MNLQIPWSILFNALLGLTFCFAKPGSITKTMPSMVRDVSAMFVDTTHFLPKAPLGRFGGAGSKILCCKFGGNVEYRGIHFISPTSGPKLSTSLCNRLHASSISCHNLRIRTISYIPIDQPLAKCKEFAFCPVCNN